MNGLPAEETLTVLRAFDPLYQRVRTITSPEARYLAHYTSVQVIEQIFKNREVWLSNPLYMNDLEEMRAGIALAAELFPAHAQIAGGTPARATVLLQAFNHYLAYLQNENAIDTYIFCLCAQEPGDCDGLLSMWREYGSKGNGAAIVFDVQRVNFQPDSPLLIAEVTYANAQERRQQLTDHLAAWSQLALNLQDNHLHLAAYAAYLFVKLIALTTKHRGFHEEREVRVIYYPERDPRGYLIPNLSYHVGTRGVEPKLKYRFGVNLPATIGGPAEVITTGSFSDLVALILLGPTVSSPLAKASFIRMLKSNELGEFEDRVYSSSIPLRPTFQL